MQDGMARCHQVQFERGVRVLKSKTVLFQNDGVCDDQINRTEGYNCWCAQLDASFLIRCHDDPFHCVQVCCPLRKCPEIYITFYRQKASFSMFFVIFELSRFARRRKGGQPQNRHILLPIFRFRNHIIYQLRCKNKGRCPVKSLSLVDCPKIMPLFGPLLNNSGCSLAIITRSRRLWRRPFRRKKRVWRI